MTDYLMPSDKQNSITANQRYEIDFSTVRRRFSLRCAFWYAAVHTMHSSWTNQCPPLCSINLC